MTAVEHFSFYLHVFIRQVTRSVLACVGGVLSGKSKALITVTAALIALATNLSAARSQEEAEITQYHIKAAFLYNFAKFVDWPSNAFREPTTPFNLCVVGVEPFISARETLVGKTIKGRKVDVRRVDSIAVAKQCHMLFVATPEGGAELDISNIKGEVLTIGESDDFLRKGGILNFKTVDNKIRFELDRDSGEHLGFKFRVQLLQRAILVDRGGK